MEETPASPAGAAPASTGMSDVTVDSLSALADAVASTRGESRQLFDFLNGDRGSLGSNAVIDRLGKHQAVSAWLLGRRQGSAPYEWWMPNATELSSTRYNIGRMSANDVYVSVALDLQTAHNSGTGARLQPDLGITANWSEWQDGGAHFCLAIVGSRRSQWLDDPSCCPPAATLVTEIGPPLFSLVERGRGWAIGRRPADAPADAVYTWWVLNTTTWQSVPSHLSIGSHPARAVSHGPHVRVLRDAADLLAGTLPPVFAPLGVPALKREWSDGPWAYCLAHIIKTQERQLLDMPTVEAGRLPSAEAAALRVGTKHSW